MLSNLLLFLLSTWLFIIPPSHEVPATRANGEDGLDKIHEQLLGKFSAAERARGNEMAKAEKPGRNIPQTNRVETVVNVGDSTITRLDVTKNGQIVVQHYRNCDERNEVIVIKPGTPSARCFIHSIDETQYAYDCEKNGKKVKHTYKVTDEIKDKAFLKEALGSSVCQDTPLYKTEILYQDQGKTFFVKELKIQSRVECDGDCCRSGWWGLCE